MPFRGERDGKAVRSDPAHRLNEAVKRNADRFPEDFAYRISLVEAESLISQIAISNRGRGGRRKSPLVFTEHGAIMAASVLNSSRTVLTSKPDLARKLAELGRSVANLDQHTRQRFEEVYAAIRAMTAEPARRGRPIGFTAEVG